MPNYQDRLTKHPLPQLITHALGCQHTRGMKRVIRTLCAVCVCAIEVVILYGKRTRERERETGPVTHGDGREVEGKRALLFCLFPQARWTGRERARGLTSPHVTFAAAGKYPKKEDAMCTPLPPLRVPTRVCMCVRESERATGAISRRLILGTDDAQEAREMRNEESAG